MKSKIIAVAGPTASGKTKLAIEIAHNVNGEIISADSRLVYKGFNIAAAKPTIEEMEGVPHHLIDIVEPEFDYSVANFYEDAKKAINEILAKGKTPIVAGGTGLYFKVLLETYSLPMVEANPDLRAEIDSMPREELLDRIKIKDKISYEKLVNADKRRIVRAYEVIKITGKPLSELAVEKEPEYDVEWKMPYIESREKLYEKINIRVDKMIREGIVEETKYLLKKHGRIKNIIDTIGYKEMIEFIDGKSTLEEAAEKLKQHTRNYAKRQLTWFRRNPELGVNC